MIHIIDNYYAQTNNYGYTVLRKKEAVDKKGNPMYSTLGYCGKLKEVLQVVLKDLVQNHAENQEITLKEAIQYVKEQTDRIEKALDGIIV